MSTVVVPCQFFLANTTEEEVARLVVGHDSGMCKAGSPRRAFGSQRHYRSLSRVDEATTAHNEWVRLNCQGEKGAVCSVALADRASRTGNVPKTNISAPTKKHFFLWCRSISFLHDGVVFSRVVLCLCDSSCVCLCFEDSVSMQIHASRLDFWNKGA